MEIVIGIIAVVVLWRCFGGFIEEIFCDAFGIFFWGGILGIVGGAIGWLIASVFFSAEILGFVAGFIVGVIIYICIWL